MPTRKREKLMGGKSPRQAQKFLAAHHQINTVFRHASVDTFALWKGYAVKVTT